MLQFKLSLNFRNNKTEGLFKQNQYTDEQMTFTMEPGIRFCPHYLSHIMPLYQNCQFNTIKETNIIGNVIVLIILFGNDQNIWSLLEFL